jgi:hypothetical protein
MEKTKQALHTSGHETRGSFFFKAPTNLWKPRKKSCKSQGAGGKKTSHEIGPHLLRYLDLKTWQKELCHKHANRKRHTHLDKKRFVKTRCFLLQSAYKLVKAQEKVMQDPRGGGKKNFSWNQSTSFALPRPQNVTNRTLPQTCKQKAPHTPWQEEIRQNQGFFFLQSAYKLVKAQEKVMQEPGGGGGKKTFHEISPHLLGYLDLKTWQKELCHKHANRKRHTQLDKKRFVENLASFPSTLQ